MNSPGFPSRTAAILTTGYAVLWASFVVTNAANMPLMDDYDAILDFLNEFTDAGMWRRLQLLLSTHNEHRIVTVRGCAAMGHLLSGTANFTWLIVVGSALWAMLAWHFIRDAARRGDHSLTVPLAALFLNVRYATLVNWAMAGLQHYAQALFGFMSIACLCTTEETASRPRQWLGYTMLYLSVFSSGAGVLVIPLIALHGLCTRRFRDLATLAAHSVFLILLTTVVFASPTASGTDLSAALAHPRGLVTFVLLFCGNLLPGKLPCHVLGLTACALLAYGAWRRFDEKYPHYFFTALLQVLVGGAAAVARSRFGAEYALESKYSVYAILLWASLIMMFARHARDSGPWTSPGARRTVLATTYLLCLGVCGCSWLSNRSHVESIAKVHWILHPSPDSARAILRVSQEKGIYDGRRYISNALE